ncbi:hypothetical protein MKX03_015893 [Papaver bracteatum]|nr:hypothetical protein MKX03_015893 [Papaver bracteatum]
MSTRDQLGDENFHEEKIDIKALLKMLVESQVKQAEYQGRQEKSQQQIIEILKSNNIAINNQKKQDTGNYADKKEITDANVITPVAIFEPGKNKPLYKALEVGKMEVVMGILRNNHVVVKEGIADDSSTALHLAIFWRRDIKIVKEIIEFIMEVEPNVLAYKTSDNGYTPCHFAAIYGYTEAAKAMVNKNSKLTQIRDVLGRTPLELAFDYVTTGQKEIVKYLYSVTTDENPSPFLGQDGVRLLHSAIDGNFYDRALCLVKRFPELVMEKSQKTKLCALELLVRKPFAFQSGGKLTWWQKPIYPKIQVYVQPADQSTSQLSEYNIRDEKNHSEAPKREDNHIVSSTIQKGILMPCLIRAPCIERLYNLKVMHEQAISLLKQMLMEIYKINNGGIEIIKFFEDNPDIIKVAITHGLTEVVLEGLEQFGHLMRYRLPDQMMIEMAIEERNEEIVNLICERGDSHGDKIDLVSATDNDGNTILHYAAKLAPSAKLNLVSGVALQMQREVQWFKGVKNIMRETDRYKRNRDGKTARHIFDEAHKDLLNKAEDWMKDTSSSCMIVAALVATVAFAAAFTVPGGNISDSNSTMNGTPVFLGKSSFTMFVVADAIALFASITSVLMFLTIYTSRYAAKDFLTYLPRKVIIGFATLFLSMAAMMIAFGASLFIIVGSKFPRAPIPIAVFTSLPILLFAWLQLPLFYNMVYSTYWSNILRQHKYTQPTIEKNYENRKRDNKIVEEIIKLMQPKTLECKTRDNGYTSCHFAAIYGNPKAAEMMVNRNSKLTQIRDAEGRTPLELAFDFVTIGQKEVVKYLYSVTRDENPSPFTDTPTSSLSPVSFGFQFSFIKNVENPNPISLKNNLQEKSIHIQALHFFFQFVAYYERSSFSSFILLVVSTACSTTSKTTTSTTSNITRSTTFFLLLLILMILIFR